MLLEELEIHNLLSEVQMKLNLKILGITIVLLLTCVTVVSAVRTGPIDYWNNEDCSGISCPGLQFKIDDDHTDIDTLRGPEVFTNSDGFEVTVTVQPYDPADPSFDPDGDRKLVTWVSNWPVSAVITKDGGGTHVFVYRYDAETSDKLSPSNYGGVEIPPNANTFGQISHLIFCYEQPYNAPEFPTLALPVGLIIGIVGLVYVVKKREN